MMKRHASATNTRMAARYSYLATWFAVGASTILDNVSYGPVTGSSAATNWPDSQCGSMIGVTMTPNPCP
jgi:hypothetical protein